MPGDTIGQEMPQHASYILADGSTVTKRKPPGLGDVPPEIFFRVIEYLNIAKDLASLSKTCRRFRNFNDQAGWRIFVQTKFPSLVSALPIGIENTSAEWRKLACCLASQSRAWDKRAFSAFRLDAWAHKALRYQNSRVFGDLHADDPDLSDWMIAEPYRLHRWDGRLSSLRPFSMDSNGRAVRPEEEDLPLMYRPQTTPFHPVIDTKLEFFGSMSSKKELVAWSTGTEVFVRVRRSGSQLLGTYDDSHDHPKTLDLHGNKVHWFTIQHEEFCCGVDDVTSINLVEPSVEVRPLSPGTLVVDLIVGRASGHLHRYSVSNEEPLRVVTNTLHSFERQGFPSRRTVRSTDVNCNSDHQLLVACSDKVISLYETAVESHDIWPVSEIEIELDRPNTQAWTTKYSSRDKLLVGLGQSPLPLHTYQVTPTELTLTGKLGIHSDRVLPAEMRQSRSNSVYAIEPLSVASRAGSSWNGDVFLSGWYDGIIRLYDLRAAHVPVSSFHDPVDGESAIYSLASFGQERFLAGSASGVLKIFDFRSAAKVYHYTDALPCSVHPPFADMPDIDRGKILPPEHPRYLATEQGNSQSHLRRCHHDFRTDVSKTCRFHELSKMDIYRPNMNIYLYGTGQYRRGRYIGDESPIFTLSSPDAICPVVYAGTAGCVYELEISELDEGGNLTDPYFATGPGEGSEKPAHYELTMYETDDGRPGKGTNAVPNLLWKQCKGNGRDCYLSLMEHHTEMNESRLNSRWHPGWDMSLYYDEYFSGMKFPE